MAERRPDPIHLPALPGEPAMTLEPERPPTTRDARWWWRGHYTAGGKTRHLTLGRGTKEQIAEVALVRRKKGLPGVVAPDRPALPTPTGEVANVRQLLGTWKAHQRKRLAAEEIEPRSFKAYGHSVRRLANAESPHQIGDVAIEDVRSSTLEDYALARAEQGHAHKTINDDIAVFLMAWKWGRKRELGPLRHLEPDLLKPKPVRPTRTPSREELLTLIEVLPLRYALLVRLMYATGSRVGEIAAMEWRDVDLARRSLRLGVYVGNRKTGERTAAIHPEVAEVLRAWRDREADPVTRSRPIAPEVRARWVLGVRPASAVSRLMKLLPDACAMVAERLKLSGEDQRFTSHAIRRWCATEMARSKVPIKTASAQQGHSEEMNAVYQQPTFEDQDEAVSAARLGVVIAFRSGTG